MYGARVGFCKVQRIYYNLLSCMAHPWVMQSRNPYFWVPNTRFCFDKTLCLLLFQFKVQTSKKKSPFFLFLVWLCWYFSFSFFFLFFLNKKKVSDIGEIIESSDGPRHLFIILLKNFHLFKIAESVINFYLKKIFN